MVNKKAMTYVAKVLVLGIFLGLIAIFLIVALAMGQLDNVSDLFSGTFLRIINIKSYNIVNVI